MKTAAVSMMEDRNDLVPSEVMRQVCKVFGDGALKYGASSWRIDNRSRDEHLNKALSHIAEWKAGVVEDHDSGCSPLAHAIVRLMIALDREGLGLL